MPPIEIGDLPVRALATRNPRETAFMRYFQATRDREGVAWQPLTAMTPLLIAAVVKAEDPEFFTHRGADLAAMARMLRLALRSRRVVGGASTITQQLARNLYLTPTRSIVRKLRELVLAVRLERALAKGRILELYLNLIEWGVDVWGAAAASEHYFQKTPADLDLFESTFLACRIATPKTPVAGRNADRMQGAQSWLAYQLFLSGLADSEACALCCQRIRHLHRLLADGESLTAAIGASRDVAAGDEGALLRQVAAALNLRRLDPASLLASHCGDAQQRHALGRLRRCLGEHVLLQVLRTHAYDVLIDRLHALSEAPSVPVDRAGP